MLITFVFYQPRSSCESACLSLHVDHIGFAVFIVSAVLTWNQSKEFVYAYYVLRTISNILSQGSIFCIAVAYAVRVTIP